jgi:hypothetical protein
MNYYVYQYQGATARLLAGYRNIDSAIVGAYRAELLWARMGGSDGGAAYVTNRVGNIVADACGQFETKESRQS